MTIPKTEKQKVEKVLKQYCADRVPDAFKDQIQIKYKIRGKSITLLESRTGFNNPDTWIDIPVAQFRYSKDDNIWTLYFPDRNSRWHEYFEEEKPAKFNDLLIEVEADPTGIFWG